MIRAALSVLSGVTVMTAYAPYAVDIIREKAVPARSTRIMFAVLLLVALLQQRQLGSGLTLAVTIGELLGSFLILGLSLKRGVDGLSRLDLACYGLLAVSLVIWLTTQNAFLALHMTVLTDVVAFMPTLVKTWHKPATETPLFFTIGLVAPLLSIVAGGEYGYAIILFPLYLAVINGIEVLLIYRKQVL